jgi:hypothetical protein
MLLNYDVKYGRSMGGSRGMAAIQNPAGRKPEKNNGSVRSS